VAVVPDEPGSTTILGLKQVWVRRGTAAPELRALRSARPASGAALIVFEGCEGRTDAEALRGLEILAERTWLPEPQADEYYAADLLGLSVLDEQGVRIGEVAGVFDAGAVPVLEIEGEKSLQVPLAEAFVKRIDLEAREIVIAPPIAEEE
jgi:16S rRNA processing protein RimM